MLVFLTSDAVVWAGGVGAALAGLVAGAWLGVFAGVVGTVMLLMFSSTIAIEADRRRARPLLYVGRRVSALRFKALLLALLLVAAGTVIANIVYVSAR